MACGSCKSFPANVIRPSTREKLCKICFLAAIETEVHNTIVSTQMFQGITTLVIGVSGGKDSTVLASIMNMLNKKYSYGLTLKLLCIDEGITGYRDKSIEVVKQNERDLSLPLTILSYEESFGYTMDKVVQKIGRKGNCTYCGVFRRGSLEDGAKLLKGEMIATGHNADDIAETVLMNYLRGDINRLLRCTHAVTETNTKNVIPRCKPLMNVYEKEIVMYAFFAKLPYFSTECTYSPGAFRGVARKYIKALEKHNPRSILDIITSGQKIQVAQEKEAKTHPCKKCLRECSGEDGICKACLLLKHLDSL
ncbi:cytoplasmic tRNA 2-thiolation protein 1 [Nematocida sp. LUAm3]|nr:cytoplasmic tRNA 2-thiolation protein 1 [Nematocida sp. LUAm3]KAI5174710.1 cytoplasmic tRNA 2-thiolation protein 1 [Nematocida sp. LUAm2]KAI5177879.1 cytoplasmic tRNA 2-thiolation protein 1 [Nematocida sp. LUAm1]